MARIIVFNMALPLRQHVPTIRTMGQAAIDRCVRPGPTQTPRQLYVQTGARQPWRPVELSETLTLDANTGWRYGCE